MSKRRLKFSKLGMGKYISHLDLLRTFTRAVHRANLPVRYSQGFNPHQLITFSLPLPIGVTSETEFVDIDFEDSATNPEIQKALNENLPPDIKILDVSELKYSANDICAARYDITLKKNGIAENNIEGFFAQTDIPVTKKTKKGEKEVNLKDFIREYRAECRGSDEVILDIVLSAGGSANIKPEIMITKLSEFCGGEFDSFSVHRTQIFCNVGEKVEIFC